MRNNVKKAEGFYTSALMLVVLLEDETEFNEQWDYLMDGIDKTDLFRETMAWDWLKRYQGKLGLTHYRR